MPFLLLMVENLYLAKSIVVAVAGEEETMDCDDECETTGCGIMDIFQCSDGDEDVQRTRRRM